MRALAPALLLALLAPAAAEAFTPPRVEGVRRCSERAEGFGTPHTTARDVRIGPVIFAGLRQARGNTLPPANDGDDRTWKAGILVKSGPPAVIAIAGGRESGVALDYAHSEAETHSPRTVAGGSGQTAVRVKPCAPSVRRFTDGQPVGRRTLFTGGFLIARPTCVTIQVYRSGHRWSRRVAFGLGDEPCPRG